MNTEYKIRKCVIAKYIRVTNNCTHLLRQSSRLLKLEMASLRFCAIVWGITLAPIGRRPKREKKQFLPLVTHQSGRSVTCYLFPPSGIWWVKQRAARPPHLINPYWWPPPLAGLDRPIWISTAFLVHIYDIKKRYKFRSRNLRRLRGMLFCIFWSCSIRVISLEWMLIMLFVELII